MSEIKDVSSKPIRPLRKAKYPLSIIFFDTESHIHEKTLKEQHSFRLGVLIHVELNNDLTLKSRHIIHYDNLKTFWDYLSLSAKPKRTLYVYAHNEKYDFVNSEGLKYLTDLGYKIPFPVIKNAFILNAKRGDKKIVFVDMFNYVKSSLKSIGKAIGLEKIDVGIDFNNISDNELKTYCQRDVEISEKFMLGLIRFLHKNELGSLKYTTASTALNCYRTKFISKPIYWHNSKELLAVEREAYHGGRVECHHLGKQEKQDYTMVDVNSMYPYVMYHCKLPTKFILTTKYCDIQQCLEIAKTRYIIADCVLKIPEIKIAPFGIKHEQIYRDRTISGLIFPVGQFRTKLHQPELLEAIKKGYIQEISQIYVYECEYCLREYVDFFYKMKSNAENEVDYYLAKLFQNSLYGKFGQREYDTDELPYSSDEEDYHPDFKDKEIGHLFFKKKNGEFTVQYKWFDTIAILSVLPDVNKSNINVALAGSVTAHARMKLYEYQEKSHFENVLYNDTDSLIVNNTGLAQLNNDLDEKRLGALKIELQSDFLKINAPKNYIFGKKKRMKGVPLSAMNINGKYYFWRFTSFLDYLNSNGNEWGRQLVDRKLKLEYNKGEVYNNITYPFIMELKGTGETWENRINPRKKISNRVQ